MGARGPRPTPKKVLESRGSWRAKLNPNEPEVDTTPPTPPDYLEPDALQIWHELVPELQRSGVLARIDRTLLIRYCQTWARWRQADQFVATNGMTYDLKDDQGNTKCAQHVPQLSIANQLSKLLLLIEREFGLTPSARSRVQVQTNGKKKKRRSIRPESTEMKIAT